MTLPPYAHGGFDITFIQQVHAVPSTGSERIASGAHGGSNAAGEHFKEACHINKSLTALGRVTTELVKSQKNGGGGHVPYRDSKLTFLLQVRGYAVICCSWQALLTEVLMCMCSHL